MFPCWAAEPSAAPCVGVVGSTRVSKAPSTGAGERGLLRQGHESAPTLTLKTIVGMVNSGVGPSILPHLQSPMAQPWGAQCPKTLGQPAGICSPCQTLLQVTAPSHGAKPKVRATRFHTLHGLAMVFPARFSQGCMTLEGHSRLDAALNTPRSGVKVPWDIPGRGEVWED